MKHFKQFFVFALMTLFSVSMWGEEASFAPSDFSGQGTSGTGSAISATVDGVTFACDKGYGTTQFRCYSGGKITISSSNTITAIAFTFSGSYKGGMETSYTGLSTTSWEKTLTSQARITACTVTYSAGSGSTPSLTASPTTIDFGTVEQGASVAAKTVAVTYSNLTGSVTYSGLSGAFAATGTIANSGDEITITPSTATVGNYNQTLTIQSSADSKSQDVIVTMNVVEPFDGLKLTFDVSSNPGEWPTANDASLTNYTYTLNAVDYTFALKNIKCNSGYLMMTATAILGLPAIEGYKLVKVEATNSSSCSTSTKVKVAVDEAGNIVSGGAEQTWGMTSSTYIYTLSNTEANTMYYLIATNKNCQLVTLDLYYEEDASALPKAVKPTFTGDETFLNSTSVSLSTTTEGASIYYTMGDAPADPTASSTLYEGPINVAATTTIKAIAVKTGMDNSPIAEKTFTKATIMTVAEARTAIDNGGDLSNKYVAGIISQIDSYNSTYNSITYWISDDGTTTDQLQVYSGLAGIALGGANFTAKEDLLVGDDVTVNGTLKKYNSIYEFDKNNSIVICKLKARLSWSATSFEAELGGSNSFPTLTNTNGVAVTYSSSNTDAAEIAADGTITLKAVGTATIKATFAGDENYKANEVSYTLNVANSMVHATISFNVDGGEAIADMTDQHELPNPLPVATKTGKNFGGWFTDVDKTIAAVAGDAITSDVVLYAKWLDPYTVAEAKAVIDATPAGTENQYVAGIISQVDNYNNTYKSITYWISADGTTTDQLEVYSGKGLSSADFSAKEDLQVGDEVVVAGTLKKYNDIYEFDKNNYLYSFNRPAVPKYSITYVENGANEDIDNVAEATKLPDPLPTVTKDGKAFGGWYTTSTFDGGTEAVAGAALTDNVTLYAKWNDISSWASVYTSNVAIASDVVSHVTIAETTYDAVKANKASTATITLPQGVTTIHLHLVAWNGEAQTVSVTGDCFNDAKELTIEANAAVSGSSTTYNLGASGVNYYFSLTPDKAVNADDVITITAASGKRFVLFGVNQEGGVLPVLESIEIGGDLTTKTGYKVGDDLDLDGLTVSATYSLGGVAQTPVDITDKLGDGLTLTYDPLVEGQTEVTITATYEGKTDDIIISGLEVSSADPKIYVDKLSVNFGTVAKDAVVADQTITVTLTNVAAATAVLGGTNPEAFSIDKTALVDGDVITISVASTATYGSYSAKITISDNAAEAEAKTINLSLAVEDVETPVSTISKWVAAEAADLVDGAEVLITGVKEAVTYAMGVQNNNNRAAVAASVDGEGVLTPGEGTMAFTLVAQGDGTFALRTSNGKYLYAAASGSNHLKTQAEVDVNAKWTLTIASAVAEGSSNRNVMQFNSGSSLFSCYGTASQTDIALYTRAKEEREGFTVGKLATVCVPYAVAQEDIIGADVYEIAGKNEAGKIVFDQVTTGGMVAGVAYLVQAKAETATFYYSGNAVAEPQNEGKALKGTFAEIDIAAADAANVYFFKDNALWSAKETGVKILANRAWLDMSAVGNAGPSPAPGRRRITMDVHGENAATGMDELNASEAPRKMIIDGKMYILRGEKMYNANGILVK